MKLNKEEKSMVINTANILYRIVVEKEFRSFKDSLDKKENESLFSNIIDTINKKRENY